MLLPNVDIPQEYFPENLEEAIKIRTKRKIFSRVIMPVPEQKLIKEGLLKNDEELRETRLISKKDYHFEASIGVLGDFMLLLVFVSEPLGILIESRELSKTFETIFDLSWNLLAKEEGRELKGF